MYYIAFVHLLIIFFVASAGEKSSSLQSILSTVHSVEKSRETAQQWREFGLWRIQSGQQYSVDRPAVFHFVRRLLLVRRSEVDSRDGYRRTGLNIGNVHHQYSYSEQVRASTSYRKFECSGYFVILIVDFRLRVGVAEEKHRLVESVYKRSWTSYWVSCLEV